MSVTIKQIAKISKVSRGTVDPEKASIVKEVADKRGYSEILGSKLGV